MVATESEVFPHSEKMPIPLSEEARAGLQVLGEKQCREIVERTKNGVGKEFVISANLNRVEIEKIEAEKAQDNKDGFCESSWLLK